MLRIADLHLLKEHCQVAFNLADIIHTVCVSGRKIHTLKIKDAISPFQLGISYHRMSWIGRNLKYDLVPTPLPQAAICVRLDKYCCVLLLHLQMHLKNLRPRQN